MLEDCECAGLVIDTGEVKFVCPSGNVYFIDEDGIKTYLRKICTSNKYSKDA